jgi:hypothetical protein
MDQQTTARRDAPQRETLSRTTAEPDAPLKVALECADLGIGAQVRAAAPQRAATLIEVGGRPTAMGTHSKVGALATHPAR